MDMRRTENADEPLAETPEDVAILYSWANLHGAKYRDFSASRREYRAQVRHRAAEELRRAELAARDLAEAAAVEAERMAMEAEREARAAQQRDSGAERARALRTAEDAARRAIAERVEAARRAEGAQIAEAVARKEEREIAEAHASAQRQANSYSSSETRRRALAGPQPARAVPGNPYEYPNGDGALSQPILRSQYDIFEDPEPVQYRDEFASRITGERRAYLPEMELKGAQGYRPDNASGVMPAYRPPGLGEATPSPLRLHALNAVHTAASHEDPSLRQASPDKELPLSADQSGPAWLYASTPSHPYTPSADSSDTLQDSRERVASRWFALKSAFDPAEELEPHGARERVTPVLALFSLAGGVGKTSLGATLGRTLSSLGEKVLLADTTSHGLLPFYFGASELRPGIVRTFSPPSGSTDAPIHLVSYDVEGTSSDTARQDAVMGKLAQSTVGTQRMILDLNSASAWMIRRISRMNATVLIPTTPDMNSVITLQAVERYFKDMVDADGRPLLPYYILNQFDSTLPLHLDVREVLRRQLGDRLLNFVIRRAPAVSEALAEGMTVVDYAHDAPVSADYAKVATWLRNIAPPGRHGFANVRWSER
jgi:cellulose synthase operon protein YhjQ